MLAGSFSHSKASLYHQHLLQSLCKRLGQVEVQTQLEMKNLLTCMIESKQLIRSSAL